MASDSYEILSRLHASGVEFVLIGGAAAAAYGSQVMTDDVDVCAPMGRDNAVRIITAFADVEPKWRMRPDMPVVRADDSYLGQLKNIYLRTKVGQLDVLGEIPGVCDYAEAARKAVTMTFGDLTCKVVDIDTLIAAKKVAGRPHDLRAIPYLERWKLKYGGEQG